MKTRRSSNKHDDHTKMMRLNSETISDNNLPFLISSTCYLKTETQHYNSWGTTNVSVYWKLNNNDSSR